MGLGDEDITGRLDVLAYRLLNGIVKTVEQQQGLSGLTETISPFLEYGVRETLGNSKVQIPEELRLFGEAIAKRWKP